MMHQTKPPLVSTQPPPLPVRIRSDEDNNNAYWLILLAALLGLLILLILMGLYFVFESNSGNRESANSESSRVVAASLDDTERALGKMVDPSATSTSPQRESVGNESSTADVNGAQADSKATSVNKNPKEDISGSEKSPPDQNVASENGTPGVDLEESPPKTESMLLIYEANTVRSEASTAKGNRTAASKPGGGKVADLAAKGSKNPFVGEGTPADSTVFVIDVSGSMQNPARLPRVVSSMKHAIEKLKPEQKFTVILFDSSFYISPKGAALLPATSTNKDNIYQWLDMAPGGGGTNPLEAMNLAIREKPERIVLLSDGEFDPYCINAITQTNQANRKPSKIDCVGLVEEVETLKEIASLNSGTYYQAH